MIGNDTKELAFQLEYEMEMFVGRIHIVLRASCSHSSTQ